MNYWRYHNQPRKQTSRPGIWRPRVGEYAPGHIGDPANNLLGGYRRFARYQNFPVRAWKLYWRVKRVTARAVKSPTS